MSKIVIMPGGFHPFHAGHLSLYNSAKEAFPDADVYVAATNDQSERPFPFSIKEKLARVAGVEPGHFVQVKSPFKAKEITQNYDPEKDVLIFVRSEKDKNESPKPGRTKKDGSPSYFQALSNKLEPFSKHAYFAYLPTVTFGPGIKSATEIRNAWPNLNEKRKLAMVMSLYPKTQSNIKLAQTVVKLLDAGMGTTIDETPEYYKYFQQQNQSPVRQPEPQRFQGWQDYQRAMQQKNGTMEEGIVIPANSKVDVYYVTGKDMENRQVLYKGIPNRLLEKAVQMLMSKYNMNPNRIEIRPSSVDDFERLREDGFNGISVHIEPELDYDVVYVDINGKKHDFNYWYSDEKPTNELEFRKDIPYYLKREDWYNKLDFPTKMEVLHAIVQAELGNEPSEYKPTVGDEPMNVGDDLDEQGVAETKSKVIARTAKDLLNPPKVMQHRAKRDIEREKTYRDAQFGRDDLDESTDYLSEK